MYAFGAMLYEGLTGKTPFEGDTFAEVARRMQVGEAVHPTRLRPDLPRPLGDLVVWAIACDRRERIESLDSLMRALAPFARPESFGAARDEAARTLLGAVREARRSKRARKPPSPTLLATGATCVALIGMVAWLWQVRPEGVVPGAAPVVAVPQVVGGEPARSAEASGPAYEQDAEEEITVDVWPAAVAPDVPTEPSLPALPFEPADPAVPAEPALPPEAPLQRCAAPRFERRTIERRVRPVRGDSCEVDAGGVGRRARCNRAS